MGSKILYIIFNLFFLIGILVSPYSVPAKIIFYIIMSAILVFVVKRLSKEEGGE